MEYSALEDINFVTVYRLVHVVKSLEDTQTKLAKATELL